MSKDPKMENKGENHMTSAAAFVEGGVQESSDDACSICLEEFNDSDPSTVIFVSLFAGTSFTYSAFLNGILIVHRFSINVSVKFIFWLFLHISHVLKQFPPDLICRCQRSSHCPMCWQPISLKDPTGQELFEGVEQERNWRDTPSRNVNTIRHQSIGNFGFQSLRMEERILQNLAIVASIERRHRRGQMEGRGTQQLDHDQSQFLLFSNQQVVPSSIFGLGVERGDNPNAMHMSSQSNPITSNEDEPLQQTQQLQNESSTNSRSDTNGLEMQSFSDTLRSKFNALSTRYKESISKGTRDWKERLFSRNSSMSELGLNARKKMNPGIASVSQSMNNRVVDTYFSNNLEDSSMVYSREIDHVEVRGEDSSCNNNRATASSTSSHSN
ncbi:hypothetical protein RYX36_032031 [Vicia faba]